MKIAKITNKYLLSKIQEITKEAYGILPWTSEQYLLDFDLTHTLYYGLFLEDELVGYAHFQKIGTETELLNIAISLKKQNLGLGSTLLRQSLINLNCKTCFLEVRKSNKKALNVYLKLGFKVIRVRKNYYQNPKEDALIMMWEEDELSELEK